jgi:hypothetical protein
MPGYHKKKNKQKKAHHNGEPHDHPHKKKQKLKERLAKIGADNKRGDVDVDKNEQYKSVESNEYYNKHDADMGGYNKDILDKVQLKNQKKVKKGKKVPQDRIPRSPNKDNNFQTRINKPLEQRALKEKQKKAGIAGEGKNFQDPDTYIIEATKRYKDRIKQLDKETADAIKKYNKKHGIKQPKKKNQIKKAELSDVTKEQKKKKGKERLVHKASKGVDTYSSQDPKNSKVKKKRVKGKIAKNRQLEALKKKLNKMKPPQGPSGGTADTPESIIKDAEAVAKTPSYIAKDHDHSITFKGYKGESYKRASLISTTGKYAKYWLLNAKQTNGNGWGVSQQSIAKNIHKFVGKPLVVTAKSWIPNSEYGDAYEHPYLPTNDINKVFDHQEKFRVGSIVDIIEKDGDYFANIEINQKFAHMVMPPFCSPAIFQNNPSEPEGQISDWEALHLAALHEDPAYGSRIALLRGTCVGTQDQCTVQFKSAKQEAKVICTKDLKGRLATLKKNDLKSKLATFRNKGAKPPEENADIIQGAFNVIEGQDAATLGINDKKYKNIDLKVRDYGEKARTEHREIGPIEGGVFAPEDEPPHPFPKDVEELVTKDVGEPEMLFGPESPTGEDMIRRDERMVPATFEYIKEKYKDSLDYIIGEDGNPVKFEIGDDGHRYMGDRSQPDSVANEGDYFSLENEKPLGIGAGAPVETRAKRQESLEEARQLVRSYIPGVKDMSNKKIDELLAYITRNDISSFNDIQVMDISNENAQRWSKLKQRIAGIQQTAFAGPPKDVIAAFREKKPLKFREKIKGRNKEYAFQTDGKTLYQSGFPIAQHTKKGIKFSYQSHPSATTAQAGRMLGINTFTKKGKTYVNGKEIDPNTDDYIEVPTKDIQEGTFKVNPNSTPVITEDKVKRNRDQEYFRNKSEKEALAGNQDLVVQTHKKKEVLDHGSITPEEQARINKITGLRSRTKRVYATDYHHSLPAEKGGGMGGGIFNRRVTSGAVPLSKKTHQEAHFPEKTIPKSFYSKLKQRLATLNMPKGGITGMEKITADYNKHKPAIKKLGKETGYTIFDGELLDFNNQEHVNKFADAYPGEEGENLYMVANTKGIHNINDKMLDTMNKDLSNQGFDAIQGGWRGKNDKRHQIDLNAVFRSKDSKKALELAKKYDQEAITEIDSVANTVRYPPNPFWSGRKQ